MFDSKLIINLFDNLSDEQIYKLYISLKNSKNKETQDIIYYFEIYFSLVTRSII